MIQIKKLIPMKLQIANRNSEMRIRLTFVLITGFALSISGCNRPEKKMDFEPNYVFAHATEMGTNYPMDQALSEAQVALKEFFGTPDNPTTPSFVEDDLKSIIDIEKLKKSAGPPLDGRGLYRKHCTSCHGVTGNGRGVNALSADVYPRDFRAGKFKFKSTARGYKPTKEDLFHTIRHGIAATPMQPIKELSDEDVYALVDYVIYLSWRGESERLMLTASEDIEFPAPGETLPADDDKIRNLYAAGTKGFDGQVELVQGIVSDVATKWSNAKSGLKQAASPEDIPVNASLNELIAAAKSTEDSPLKASIERGKVVFAGSCNKCHGPLGHGDGQNTDYDEWTKDWTTNKIPGISPADMEALIPLLARGGLPPKFIVPRDLRQGVYRGGGAPEKLYLRIAQGIEGTPMPAGDGAIPTNDIWHLVNYVRSLALPPKDGVVVK
jgi:mono/diheme cytochrome c family protein